MTLKYYQLPAKAANATLALKRLIKYFYVLTPQLNLNPRYLIALFIAKITSSCSSSLSFGNKGRLIASL